MAIKWGTYDVPNVTVPWRLGVVWPRPWPRWPWTRSRPASASASSHWQGCRLIICMHNICLLHNFESQKELLSLRSDILEAGDPLLVGHWLGVPRAMPAYNSSQYIQWVAHQQRFACVQGMDPLVLRPVEVGVVGHDPEKFWWPWNDGRQWSWFGLLTGSCVSLLEGHRPPSGFYPNIGLKTPWGLLRPNWVVHSQLTQRTNRPHAESEFP